MKIFAREKLAEKNIKWVEAYTPKTSFLKEQFNDVIGSGSYFRFEGVNLDNGDEYYCVLSPANIHKPRAKFFAGVRKLPATYSAGGKYFDSMDRAAEYARETWGISVPDNLKPYTSAHLYGISGKVHKWKIKHEHEQENKEDIKKSKKDKNMIIFNAYENMLEKEAMGKTWMHGTEPRQTGRDASRLFDFNIVQKYMNAPPDKKLDPDYYGEYFPVIQEWDEIVKQNPFVKTAYREARNKITSNLEYLRTAYGIPQTEGKNFMKNYIAYNPMHGFHIVYVAPYISSGERHGTSAIVTPAINKFVVSTKHFDSATPEQILASVSKQISEYTENFGITFEPSDFGLSVKSQSEEIDPTRKKQKREAVNYENVDPDSKEGNQLYSQKPLLGTGSSFYINRNGMKKIIESFARKSPAWKEVLDNILTEQAKASNGNMDNIKKLLAIDTNFMKTVYDELKKKYESMPKEQAAIMGLVPPPKWKMERGVVGQQSGTKPQGPRVEYGDVKLRLEILNLLRAGIEEEANKTNIPLVDKIQENLNKNPKRKLAKFLIPKEEVQKMLDQIKLDIIVKKPDGTTQNKTYDELFSEYSDKRDDIKRAIDFLHPRPGTTPDINSLTGNSANYIGYNNLEDALKAAMLHFSGQPVDPGSRALLGVAHSQLGGIEIDKPDYFVNTNINNLVSFKQKMEEKGEPPAPEATAKELGVDIGFIEPTKTQEIPAPEVTEKVEEVKPLEAVEETAITPEIKPEDVRISEEDLMGFVKEKDKDKTIATTVNNLIKIAEELDNEGKYNSSEEVHKIIRKYVSQIPKVIKG